MATPLIFAAMGGLISEKSGVMNIALEGLMLIGAFFALWARSTSAVPGWGLLSGSRGGLARSIHAYWCIALRADQIVAGTAINLLGGRNNRLSDAPHLGPVRTDPARRALRSSRGRQHSGAGLPSGWCRSYGGC